jgi:hypothetical protein
VLLPAVLLIAVVVVALGGRMSTSRVGGAAVAVGSPAAVAVAAASPEATTPPAATTSPRSDWPAAISPRHPAPTVAPLPREHGTDGLMGRLPFGLPNDTPTIRVERANRFTLDDAAATRSGFDTTPPWVRRLGGGTSVRTDANRR